MLGNCYVLEASYHEVVRRGGKGREGHNPQKKYYWQAG